MSVRFQLMRPSLSVVRLLTFLRVYACNTIAQTTTDYVMKNDAQWYQARSNLVEYVGNTEYDLANVQLQERLESDYEHGIKTLYQKDGIASYDFRGQFRSFVPPIVKPVVSGGSLDHFDITTPGVGFTSVPSLTYQYARTFTGGSLNDSLTGFDDAAIFLNTSSLGGHLTGDFNSFYAGSGYINGTYELIIADSNHNLYATRTPKGYAVISGGQVTEVHVTDDGGAGIYPPVYAQIGGKIVNGQTTEIQARDYATVEVTLNPDTSLQWTVVSGGSGYTSTPVFTTSGGTDMTFARCSNAVVSGGQIQSVTMTNTGAGYISNSYTSVTFKDLDETGVGAEGYAVVTNGSVTGVVVTNNGSGYSANTQVFVNGGRPWAWTQLASDAALTGIGAMVIWAIKCPFAHTMWIPTSTSYELFDREPFLNSGELNNDAKLTYPGLCWQAYSFLPKIYQYKIDYPNNTLQDYINDYKSYIVSGITNPATETPFVGSFDVERFSTQKYILAGIAVIPTIWVSQSGDSFAFFDFQSNVFHYDEAQTYGRYLSNVVNGINAPVDPITIFSRPVAKNNYYLMTNTLLKDNFDTLPSEYMNTNFEVYASLSAYTSPWLVTHEFGHTAGLDHPTTNDLCYSTGVGQGGDFLFGTVLGLDPDSPLFMTVDSPGLTMKAEDGSSMLASYFNVMAYGANAMMYTKEQRLIMRYFMAFQNPEMISNVSAPGDVNTAYLDQYLDATDSNVFTSVEASKLRSYSVISDKVQSRKVEADTMLVNGQVTSQISKTELGIFDTIVLGNGQKSIYLDDNGRLVLGDIMIYNDNGVIKFEPVVLA